MSTVHKPEWFVELDDKMTSTWTKFIQSDLFVFIQAHFKDPQKSVLYKNTLIFMSLLICIATPMWGLWLLSLKVQKNAPVI